jgi:hypothetical protein
MCPSMIRKLKVIVYFRNVIFLSKFKYFCFVTILDISLISRSCKNDHIIKDEVLLTVSCPIFPSTVTWLKSNLNMMNIYEESTIHFWICVYQLWLQFHLIIYIFLLLILFIQDFYFSDRVLPLGETYRHGWRKTKIATQSIHIMLFYFNGFVYRLSFCFQGQLYIFLLLILFIQDYSGQYKNKQIINNKLLLIVL